VLFPLQLFPALFLLMTSAELLRAFEYSVQFNSAKDRRKMAKFNTAPVDRSKTINRAGGPAYAKSTKLELVSFLLTSFVKDQFYRSADQGLKALTNLVADNPLFAAKAAIYARTQFGMRSVSHAVAVDLMEFAKGHAWAKRFYDRVIFRPDDMTEIRSLYQTRTKKNGLPHAVSKGFAAALTRFDAYQLGKYRGEGKGVSLVDIVNYVHPQHSEALQALVKDELRATGTWESKLTQAGQQGSDEEEVKSLKRDAWAELISSKKLGYFALLRNLRNIIEQAPECVDAACAMLVDEKLIRKSLVMPFRYQTAADEIRKLGGSNTRPVLKALNEAVDKSVANVPRFDGRTLIALDGSGSMSDVLAIATLFAAVLYKSQDADCIIYSDSAEQHSYTVEDSTLTIASQMSKDCPMSSTDFSAVFRLMTEPYDRVIFLSDMQSWVNSRGIPTYFNRYVEKIGKRPKLYSWDLSGYGTLEFPERDVYALSGFSEKVFDLMKLLETDRNAMVHAIEEIEL